MKNTSDLILTQDNALVVSNAREKILKFITTEDSTSILNLNSSTYEIEVGDNRALANNNIVLLRDCFQEGFFSKSIIEKIIDVQNVNAFQKIIAWIDKNFPLWKEGMSSLRNRVSEEEHHEYLKQRLFVIEFGTLNDFLHKINEYNYEWMNDAYYSKLLTMHPCNFIPLMQMLQKIIPYPRYTKDRSEFYRAKEACFHFYLHNRPLNNSYETENWHKTYEDAKTWIKFSKSVDHETRERMYEEKGSEAVVILHDEKYGTILHNLEVENDIKF